MTIFDKIISKEIPAKIIYEDDICLAFHDVNPQAPVHALLIPKTLIRSMAEVDSSHKEILGHMMTLIPQLTRLLGLAQDGYRLVVNTNDNGGQTVFHLHIHILGGRKMNWPPG